jgi:hypothetical protein
MKQFLTPSVLSAAAGLVFIFDKHPAGALAFIVVLLIFTLAHHQGPGSGRR